MKDINYYEDVAFLKHEFQVRFFKCEYNRVMPHWHEHTEFLFFSKAEGTAFCDEKSFSVCDGDLVVANSAEMHSALIQGKTEFYCMILSSKIFEDINVNGKTIQNHIQSDPVVKEIFECIHNEKEKNIFGSDMIIKSHVYRLLAYLYQNYGVASEKENANEKKTKLARLDIVAEYMAQHYTEKIKVSDLAKLCYLSEEYFCRFFKNATGYAVTEYITTYRMEKAVILLKNTDDSISEISWKTGFDDANYFARVFKKTYNKTPSQYRKEEGVKEE